MNRFPSSVQQQSSKNKSQRKRSKSRTINTNNLCRQDSVSNLSCLQNEISSMLHRDESNKPDQAMSQLICESRKPSIFSSSSNNTNSDHASSVMRSESQRTFQSRCSYETLASKRFFKRE